MYHDVRTYTSVYFEKGGIMKILIINGSPRTKGVTATVLHMMEEELVSRGADVEFVNLSEIKMSHCLGCCRCYTTGHCCIDDDAEVLSKRIADADGIVLGSPTYASNVSGLMKDCIDRGHFVIEQLLNGKYCITLATGENYGNGDVLKILNNLVLFSGGKRSAKIKIRVPFGDTNTVRKNTKEIVRKSASKLVLGIKNKKRYPIQRGCHFVIFNLGIKPFVKKKQDAYRGVTEKWESMGIG